MKKFDVVNALTLRHGYRRYLEICTPLTGMTFHRVDRDALEVCHRLMYRCPRDFSDGSEITFRTESDDIDGLLPRGATYDILFIDGWHTYECSRRDLHEGFSRLQQSGSIVMHDIDPKKRAHTSNAPLKPWGAWNGPTYCAYFDFILDEPQVISCVVDTDGGCAVIKRIAPGTPRSHRRDQLVRAWFQRRAEHGFDVFEFFLAHRQELANVISIDEFLRLNGISKSKWRPSWPRIVRTVRAELRNAVATRPHRILIRRLARGGWLS